MSDTDIRDPAQPSARKPHHMPEFPDPPLPARLRDPALSPWQREALTRLHFASGRGAVVNGPLIFKTRYSPAEAAEILGISKATLDRERRAGRIACYRPGAGRRLYYLENHLDDYIQNNTVAPCVRKPDQDKSENTGLAGATIHRLGAGHGSPRKSPDGKRDARASALKTLMKPSSD